MAREELKQKAKEYLTEFYCSKQCSDIVIRECKNGERIRCVCFEDRLHCLTSFAEQVTKELEAQIAKMKCCENCRHRELIREHGQWKERFNCKGNRCVCHSKWEIKGND